MKYRAIICLAGVTALGVAALVAFAPSLENAPPQTVAAEAPTECSACTLRHQGLGKIKEVRERERAELRELLKNSKSNSQQQ
jgi:hypothetical protein